MEKVSEFFRQKRVQQEVFFNLIFQLQSNYNVLISYRRPILHTVPFSVLVNPTKWITGAITQCAIWDGNDRRVGFKDIQKYRGGLLRQFELSRDFLQKCLRLNRLIDQHGSTEEWEIPLRVLEEALTNALVHREYVNRRGFHPGRSVQQIALRSAARVIYQSI